VTRLAATPRGGRGGLSRAAAVLNGARHAREQRRGCIYLNHVLMCDARHFA